ncbi:MAG: universal stress protein [Nitrospiraceae bacterium]|nr:universal stress protein [Nitrospiraceae bacterium]
MNSSSTCSIQGLKNILLASDGSTYSEKAMREAISLAKACHAKLYVISVIEINAEYATMAPNVVEKIEQETKELLDEVKACVDKEGIESEMITHEGQEAWRSIVEEAKAKKVDMIVMGSHGRTGLTRLLMGSVTAKVIGHMPCKVLVVPA